MSIDGDRGRSPRSWGLGLGVLAVVGVCLAAGHLGILAIALALLAGVALGTGLVWSMLRRDRERALANALLTPTGCAGTAVLSLANSSQSRRLAVRGSRARMLASLPTAGYVSGRLELGEAGAAWFPGWWARRVVGLTHIYVESHDIAKVAVARRPGIRSPATLAIRFSSGEPPLVFSVSRAPDWESWHGARSAS